MTAIDRTAYPRLNKPLSDQELSACYGLDDSDLPFIYQNARNNRGYLTLAVMLKTRQQLGYFIELDQVSRQIVHYLAKQLGVPIDLWVSSGRHDQKTLYRYRLACRQWMGSIPFSADNRNSICICVRQAAYTMSDPADLINVAVETLTQAQVELPAFSTLERLVGHERQSVHNELYQQVTESLTREDDQCLEALLEKKEGELLTGFARLKQTPGPATLKHFRVWAKRLEQLDSLLDPKPLLEGVAYTKIRQFAAEASACSIGDMRGIQDKTKRYTLLLCLLHQTQSRTRDELIDMFLKRMKRVQRAAQERLWQLQEQHRDMEEALIGVLGQVVQQAAASETDDVLGKQVRQILDEQGGVEDLTAQLQHLTAYHQNNYWPFLWPIHATNRAVIFQVLNLIVIRSATQNQSLLQALDFVRQHRQARKEHLPATVDLCFASQRWQRFVCTKVDGKGHV